MYITEKRLLKWALYSNIIYVSLLFLIRPQGINIQKIGITSFLLFSAIAILTLCIKNWKDLKAIPKLTRVLFYFIIIFGVICIIRGFSFSIQDWVTNFGNVYMGFAWLVPMVLILGLKIENWNVVFKAIRFMFYLMIVLFFLSLFIQNKYVKWAWLLRPVNFILLVGIYKYKLLGRLKIVLIVGIYLFVALKVKQRMDLLFLFLTFCFITYDRLFSHVKRRLLLRYIFWSFVFIFIFIFTIGYETLSNTLAKVIEFQDSRTFVYNELISELTKSNELVFGRGSLGTYFSEFFEHTRKYWEYMGRVGWKGDSSTRITIEVGYLQMVLKGGLVLLLLNVSIALYTIYIALFKSNNKFIKRLGYFILILSILSLVSFRPAFAPTFIIFWMSIGTVLNKKYRTMNNEEMKKLIHI